ncbi:hypothetical protein E5161_01305 [Cohnella pontilimi]|uniref:DZANK-type domain-containing protein n=1 Tax=Cohnella pontilimi TaxID=2564100 RepID=A0A4U0FGE3_9BACL|nr:hypothetical protein [Cohnella pontilimi]TJY44063.1 hypothetical protein E5161_01305 [Cohnella pontilimi]
MADKEIQPCVRCAKLPGEKDAYCTDCGAPLVNRCIDEPGILKKGCGCVNPPTAAYCHKCGEPTTFNFHGLVTPAYQNANKPFFFS